jgi:hypothetical protein
LTCLVKHLGSKGIGFISYFEDLLNHNC